jgi:chromosome segregation ATPase
MTNHPNKKFKGATDIGTFFSARQGNNTSNTSSSHSGNSSNNIFSIANRKQYQQENAGALDAYTSQLPDLTANTNILITKKINDLKDDLEFVEETCRIVNRRTEFYLDESDKVNSINHRLLEEKAMYDQGMQRQDNYIQNLLKSKKELEHELDQVNIGHEEREIMCQSLKSQLEGAQSRIRNLEQKLQQQATTSQSVTQQEQ